jgi:uncharacterized repeat protein (TIGR03803 family)
MNRGQCPRFAIRVFGLFMVILASVSLASAEWKEKVPYSFKGGSDGEAPVGRMAGDKSGNLYGATQFGGADNCSPMADCGTVYQLRPPAKNGDPWTEKVLHVFQGKAVNDGDFPGGGLVIDSLGNLYGTTYYGGMGDCVLLGIKGGCGVVFEFSPPENKGGIWKETIIYSFKGGDDGYVPFGDLTFDRAGNLYGVTLFGGGKGAGLCDPFYQGCGTVFKLSPPTRKGGKWTEAVLHSFAAGTDGYNPNGGLLLDSEGVIYGTTALGGNQLCNFQQYEVGCGIMFKLVPPAKMSEPWTEQTLLRFTDGKNGAGPNGNLIFDTQGRLYGTAGGGDAQGCGVVFRMTPAGGLWSEAVLYEFTCGNDGQGPAPLIIDKLGDLYGTSIGGPLHEGVAYRLRRPAGTEESTWNFNLLYTFQGAPECGHPVSAPLTFNSGGLYGTAYGGEANQGCVFDLIP